MDKHELNSNTSRWKQKLVDLFGIDPRSLAVFRIGLASVVLYDLVDRVADFDAMYRDSGILSVADARAHFSPSTWSLYFVCSADWYQGLLLALTFLASAMLLVGCFTRLATLATWILLVSLHWRMPLVLSAGDTWLRLMLFWSVFLPLGHVWSLDAWRGGRTLVRASLKPVLSVASAGVLCQVIVVYLFAGISKWNDVWLNGDAMYYVFDQLVFTRPLGKTLLQYPWICRILSFSTPSFEMLAPLLMLVPWKTPLVRMAALLTVFSFHLGIELTLNVGQFSYIAFSSWLLFLPTTLWESNFVPRFARTAAPGRARRPLNALLEPPAPNRGKTGFCACALAFVLVYNLSWVADGIGADKVREAIHPVGWQLRLAQRWRMFGSPYKIDPWCVYRARLQNGNIVDIARNGSEPQDVRPDTNPPILRNHRWKKLHHGLALSSGENPERLAKYRQLVAEYVCRRWNREHAEDEQIIKLEVLLFGTQIGPTATKSEYSQGTFARVEVANPEEGSEFQDELLRILRDEDPFSVKY